jgi:SSS family solute:Na+ symporter
MVGSVGAAYFALSHEKVGGLSGMVAHFSENPDLASKLDIFPSESSMITSLIIIPLAVQWWASYFPGAEPGGGGYLVQRMLAAKDEKNAIHATLFFNFAHYALRPWPWIIVALCSMIVFPDLDSIKAAFPHAEKVADDSAYSAMLTFLPAGWMGLVLTSLIAAYMSTISTHLNWGSSYIVNDIYMRFIQPDSTPQQQVWVGRCSTVILMLATAFVAMMIDSASEAFTIVIMMGAGTGGLLIVRWFWWRINAYCEIVAMIVSFVCAIILSKVISPEFGEQISQLFGAMEWSNLQILISVFITTSSWLLTAFVAPQTEASKMAKFVELVNPGGPGWKKIHDDAIANGTPLQLTHVADSLPRGVLCMFLGCVGVYSLLFAIGYSLYGRCNLAIGLFFVSTVATITLSVVWSKRKTGTLT